MLERTSGILNRLKRLPYTLKGWGRDAKAITVQNSPQERAFKIEQVLHGSHTALTNHHIWGAVVQELGELADVDRQKILDAYTVNKEEVGKDIPVAELMEIALGQRQRDYFLKKVAFNYDYPLKAEERFSTAQQELTDKKRNSIPFDWEMWTLDHWVEMELIDAAQTLGIRRFSGFDQKKLEKVEGYKFDFDTGFIRHIKSVYDKGFFRLLDDDQIVKAAFTKRMHSIYSKPTIICR